VKHHQGPFNASRSSRRPEVVSHNERDRSVELIAASPRLPGGRARSLPVGVFSATTVSFADTGSRRQRDYRNCRIAGPLVLSGVESQGAQTGAAVLNSLLRWSIAIGVAITVLTTAYDAGRFFRWREVPLA
jgi:hypothetical protein